MRTTQFMVGLTVFFLCMTAAGPVIADCEGGPVFSETIQAQDRNTFVWATATNVSFAKGQLRQLPGYTIWARGELAGTDFLDVSGDHPGPGAGLFYLVKATGPPCGSWQTAGAAEPRRDTDIRPGCNSLAPTDEQIADAVTAAHAVAPHAWSDPDDALLYHEVFQEHLGCAFDLIENSAPLQSSFADFPDYDPDVHYCGFGSTAGYPSWVGWAPGLVGIIPASSCMNQACYNHDYDYHVNCAGGFCAFSPQTTLWDAILESYCQPAPDGCLQLFNQHHVSDLSICLYVQTSLAFPNPIFCQDPPCNDPGQTCNDETSQCCWEAPVSWWRAEDDTTDSVGGSDGSPVGDVTYLPGVDGGQAFSLDGQGDYIELGDVLNGVTVPFSIEGWINTPGSRANRIFTSDDHPSDYAGFVFWVRSSRKLQISYRDADDDGPEHRRTKVSVARITPDTWVHVAATVRGSQNMTLYINGENAGGSYSGTGGPMSHGAGLPARIGRRGTATDEDFEGLIDELAVHNRSLSEQEIQAIVAEGHEATCPVP